MTLYYFSIFQYHNNDTTNINTINTHLTVIVSLRVPPLPAYDWSNLDVILLLLGSLALSCLTLPLSNLTTASLFLYSFGRYCKIRKLSGSHNFMTHSPKIGSMLSIFMRIEYLEYCTILLQSHGAILGVMIIVLILNTN